MDETLSYDEFGVPLHGQNRNNPFGFTGYQMDEVTGMYFAQARYYDPRRGRFMSEDFLRDGKNYYLHCYDNPLRLVDLNGLKPTVTEAAQMADHIYDPTNPKKELTGGWEYEYEQTLP